MLEQMVIDICAQFRLEYGEKDKEGFYSLKFPTQKLRIKDLDPGVLMRAPLGPVQGGGQENLALYLMQGNYLRQGTGQGVLAIDPKNNAFNLLLTYPHVLNFRIFQELLEDFVNYAIFWKEEISKKIISYGVR